MDEMDNNEIIARAICEHLDAGMPLILGSIVASEGSSPRHGGAKMVVDEGGLVCGTIGGGLLEAQAIDASRKALRDRKPRLMDFDLEGTDASSKDMICGGTARVLLDLVEPGPESTDFFSALRRLTGEGRDFYALTVLDGSDAGTRLRGRSLLMRDGTVKGTYPWTAGQLETLRSELHNVSSTDVMSMDDVEIVIDPIRRVRTMYCFGAGHVAVPTARLAATVGFSVVVVDDRDDFASADRFPDAASIVITDNFVKALDGLPIDADSFVVIVTRGHRYDREVLEQALKTSAGYIGMIGSRRKRDTLYAALIKGGITQAQLDRVHSPIGLAIHAETPEEIAVSIVGEMIAERARLQA
jgi:xanthine dehydrogenase accessory factor